MMETVRTSETSIYFYEITQSHFLEGSHLLHIYYFPLQIDQVVAFEV
jgi:hypothetical protein